MARKKEENKAAAIRDYLKKHPNEKAQAIAVAMQANGVDVTAQYVSMVRSKMAGASPTKKKGKALGLVEAVELIQQMGGVAGVERAIKQLEEMSELQARIDQLGGIDAARELIETVRKLK